MKPVEPVAVRGGSGRVKLEATLEGAGTINWYEKRSDGSFTKKGSGPSFDANFRVKRGEDAAWYYVAVTGEDGVEGGKIPVRIPVKQ